MESLLALLCVDLVQAYAELEEGFDRRLSYVLLGVVDELEDLLEALLDVRQKCESARGRSVLVRLGGCVVGCLPGVCAYFSQSQTGLFFFFVIGIFDGISLVRIVAAR